MTIFLLLLAWASSSSANLQEIPIPNKIFEMIKGEYHVDKSDIEPEMVDVSLEIKTKQAPQKFPIGYTQETLDLAQYITKMDKSLKWTVTTPYDVDAKNTTVYFMPRYKPFKSAMGNTYGYECGTVFKYAKNSSNIVGGNALNIMTNVRQYLSILGGDYLVLHLDGKKLKISYFKVRDTRWTHEMCKLDY